MTMPRSRLIIFILLALAFASVATFKSLRARREPPISAEEQAQRDKVLSFWDSFRQASKARMDGDYAAAVELYKKALQFKPQHEDSLYYVGNCYFELQRYDDALKAYQNLIAANPEGSSRGYVRLGLIHACFAPRAPLDLNKADKAFRQALAMDPDSGALLGVAEVALLQGKWQEAQENFEGENQTNHMSVAAPYFLGYLLYRQGKKGEAWEWFRQAVKRCEVKKPPVPWSEEGNLKASPELRWRALAKQSVLGEHWIRLRRYLKDSNISPATMEEEYRRLHEFVSEKR
jgi:tetratricopeptide (TPR) repeat protein